MILIGLGSNLATSSGGPRDTVLAAIEALRRAGYAVVRFSPLYTTAPVGPADQPWFVNAVVELKVSLTDPEECLHRLHAIERAFDRRRTKRWQARSLDLDLLDWHGVVRPDAAAWRQAVETTSASENLVLPHPRLHLRRFVLQPLLDIAPAWRHPVLGRTAGEMVAAVEGQAIERL